MVSTFDPDSTSLQPRTGPSHDRGSAATVRPVGLRGDTSSLFRSFWIGGFESASHINRSGARIDMVSATQHDVLVREDYTRLSNWGIRLSGSHSIQVFHRICDGSQNPASMAWL